MHSLSTTSETAPSASALAIHELSAAQALHMLSSNQLALNDYWEALAQRAQATTRYNALTTDFQPHRTQNGRLHGLPFLVKDSIDVAGMLTTAGTPALQHHRAIRHAPIVKRLLDQGAAVAGKTTMHELSFGGTSNNALHGHPKNPWNPDKISGGSSGGVAAAVALGIAPFGIGSDTGGSIRVPAALCGIYGFRPSTDRYPTGDYVPLSWTRDALGPLARNMEDIVLLDAALSNKSSVHVSKPTKIRLGTSPGHSTDIEADVATTLNTTLERFVDTGMVEIVEVDVDDVVEQAHEISQTLVFGEFEEALSDYLAGTGVSLDDLFGQIGATDVAHLVHTGRGSVSRTEHHQALSELCRLQRTFVTRLAVSGVDALVFPTCPITAPPIGAEKTTVLNGRAVPTFGTLMRHGAMAGTLKLPGLSLPAGHGSTTGMPIGIEITAAPGSDTQLLSIGMSLADMMPKPCLRGLEGTSS